MIGYISKLILLVMDVVLVNIAFLLSLLLRFEGTIEPKYIELYQQNYIILTLAIIVVFFVFNLYKSLWRYASVREMVQIVAATITGTGVFLIIGSMQGSLFPKSVYIINVFVLTGFMIGSRFGYRLLRNVLKYSEYYSKKIAHKEPLRRRTRIMIIGAGEAASIIIKDLKQDKKRKQIVVVVDDDKSKQYANLHGVPVRGDTSRIPKIADYYEADEIIIAIPSASKKRIAEVAKICSQTKCNLKIFRGIERSIDSSNKSNKNRLRPVRIEDLLGREEVKIDNDELSQRLGAKTIMVTGGGGSIGSELCRQILCFNPSKVVVFDIYENTAYDLQTELMRNGIAESQVDVIIGSVRDKDKLRQVFESYRPHMVFHAAAHKHVPLMEFNPEEAVKNNVFGTLNVAQCAIEFKTEKFIMISTDKAVNPTNVMGATKRLCEMIIQSIDATSEHTDFVAVRFGNVLGSNGSVIPLFKKQLEAGGPLTITHPDIIRYFMTIPEAVRLILEASTFAHGGEIFVLDMGEPVKIVDLARNLIRLSGFKEGRDMEIVFTGLRPGEKLFEELLMEEEGLGKTRSEKIFVAMPGDMTFAALEQKIQRLGKSVETGGDVRALLREIVPTYQPEGEQTQQKAI